MKNKHIIIILLVIIALLSAGIVAAFLNPATAKEPVKIKITSDNEQYEGGNLSIKLTDLNRTPLSKEIVNTTITNSNGEIVFDNVVKTDSKGKAKWDLDLNKGNYTVNVTYDGNEKYAGNNTTQNLTIKEEVVEAEMASDSDPGAFYSQQAGRVIYTGEIQENAPDGHTWKHLGYNQWEKID